MKKIFALIISFIFLTTNAGFAFSDLYYLYNITEQNANNIVKTNLQNLNYRIVNENPYYVIYNKSPNKNAVIILQQSGANLYYYYYSPNKNNNELNHALLKSFKNSQISYERQINNTNVINIYDNIAQKTINSSGHTNRYTFDDEEQINTSYNQYPYNSNRNYNYNANNNSYTPRITYSKGNQTAYSNNIPSNAKTTYTLPAYPPQSNVVNIPKTAMHSSNGVQTAYFSGGTNVKSQPATVLKGSVVSIDTGTIIKVYLQNPINTSSANVGDKVVAVLTDDLIYNGVLAIPQGSLVYGTLSKARHATYGSRNGRVVIEFNQLVTPDNKVYEISAEKIDFTVTNDGKIGTTVGNAVAGAAVGALAGLLFAALGNGNLGTSAAIGAGVGAGTSLIGSGVERGVDAEIPSFTQLELTLTKPFRVSVSY